MLTEAQQREYEMYRLTDLLAEQLGWDDPFRVHHEEDLLIMAEQALDDVARGDVQPYHFLVIPYQDGNTWGYRAVEPGEKVEGCAHSATSASRHLAKAEVIAEHRHLHMGGSIEGLA